MSNPFAGKWTYRSFHNDPAPADNFQQIRLAEAELVLAESGPNWLSGRLSFGDTAYLEMTGVTTEVNGTWQLRMRAIGPRDNETYGWIYDYVGMLAPDWKDADRQVPAIVGTVTRSAYHDVGRMAGQSYSFVAVSQKPKVAEPTPLPPSVVAHFADREHRLHHAVWHALRNDWLGLDESQRALIALLGWEPPRVGRLHDGTAFVKSFVMNGSGEDFLYMHRDMVAMFRTAMRAANAQVVTWNTIPEPGAKGQDVPPAWSSGETFERRIRALKTDEFYWSRMRWWDQQFKDPTYLSTLTLGQLGSLLEYSVHNDMHMRWSAPPRDPLTNVVLQYGRPDDDFSTRWDDPRYDWLGDFYSSHVNPFFWRLHGWVDDRIADWFDAHEAAHPGQIVKKEVGDWIWFETGRWVQVENAWVWPAHLAGGNGGGHGGHHHMHGAGMHDHDGGGGEPDLRERRIRSLEAVLDVINGRAPKPEALAEAPGDGEHGHAHDHARAETATRHAMAMIANTAAVRQRRRVSFKFGM